MEFGKLPNVDHVDFTLPPDNVNNSKVLDGKPAAHPAIYVGCAVWADKGFVGKIYPEDAQEKNFLKYYATQFNCIELNATHYKIPTPGMVQRWLEMTNDGFRFCPKVPQLISHAKNINDLQGLMEEFIEAILLFGKQLGTSFMQLPPHFGPDRLNELITFLSNIPQPLKLAIELRHENWFTDTKAFDALGSFLMECNYSLVISDTAGRRDVVHQRLTNKTMVLRSVSNDLHPSDFPRLDDWAERISHWLANGLEELYFFIHTGNKAWSPELANHFITALNQRANMQLPLVKIRQQPVQGSLFDF